MIEDLKTNPKSVKDYVEIVSYFTDVPVEKMKSKKQTREIVNARHICYYILKEHTIYTLSGMGAMFNDNHYSTVIHAIEKIKGYLQIRNPWVVCRTIAEIEDYLKVNN